MESIAWMVNNYRQEARETLRRMRPGEAKGSY